MKLYAVMLVLVVMLPAAHGSCPNHIKAPELVYIRGVCDQGPTELVWAEGLGRTPVELHDCVLLPEVFALDARTCCGDLCSGPPTGCVDSQCCICQRTLDATGRVM